MNPFIENSLRRLVPILLAGLVPWLAKIGLSADDAQQFVAGLAAVLIAGVLSVWQTYRSRQVKLVGQAVGRPISEEEAKGIVAAGNAPSVTTPQHVVPQLGSGKG